MGLAGAVSPDPAGRRVCDRRPQREDVPPAMGSDPGGFPPRLLLHGFLGGVRERDSAGAAHGGRQRVGADGARRAVESNVTSTTRALCASDIVVLEIVSDA